MKLLLDENVPHLMRGYLAPPHEVSMVSRLGWSGIGNGELLKLAAAKGFDALITMDRGMQYQQNATTLPCSVVVMIARTNRIEDLQPLVPILLASLSDAAPKSFMKIGS